MRVPFSRPDVGGDEARAVTEVLDSGWLTNGPRVDEFEQRIDRVLGVDGTICVNSGTAALHLALLAEEIGPGDEVVVPSLTFSASVNVIEHVGATPVFVEVDPQTLCLDVEDLERRVTSRTRAVIAVHFAGYPCDVVLLRDRLERRGIALIEDAAHAFGARLRGELLGRHGDYVCFSFYASKTITTGEGGALVVKDAQRRRRARALAWHGIERRFPNGEPAPSWSYEVRSPGFKYNMSDLQAAIGIVQLAKYGGMQHRRERVVKLYNDALRDLQGSLTMPARADAEGSVHAWHLYCVRLRDPLLRDDFITSLRGLGVATSVHYNPVHRQAYYRKYHASLRVTELAGASLVSLPLFSSMSLDEVDHVIASVRRVMSGWRAPKSGSLGRQVTGPNDAPAGGAHARDGSEDDSAMSAERIVEVGHDRTSLLSLLLVADPREQRVLTVLAEGEMFVLERDGQPIGVAHVVGRSQEELELLHLAVEDKFRHSGRGSALVEHVIRWARARGYRRVTVGTGNSSLANLRLYQRMGFRLVSVVRGYFDRDENIVENGIACLDLVVLELDLSVDAR